MVLGAVSPGSPKTPRAGILRPVDGVALASVITSGAAVIATSGVAVWTVWQSAKLARVARVQQRLAESYVEVLRIVEREGQWVEASITQLKVAVEGDEYGEQTRVRLPEPAVTDRATIAAHLAAFGSDNVRELYRAWRSAITAIETEEEMLREFYFENFPEEEPSLKLKNLLKGPLQPKELAARRALADAIAEELGHR